MQTTQAECPTCRRMIHIVASGDTCDFSPGFGVTCKENDVFKCALKQAIAMLKAMDPSATVTRHRAS